MVRVALDFLHRAPHDLEHGFIVLVVNVALDQLEDIFAVARILKERREIDIELVIQADEFVPVFEAAADDLLEAVEAGAAEVAGLGGGDDGAAGVPGGVEGHAHPARKDRVHKAGGVADHDVAIAADLLHGVAVVALNGPGADPFRLAKPVGELGEGVEALPEELLALILASAEVGAARDDPYAGDALGD